MESKREQTKNLIAVSLMELMRKTPFEKITIRMLTENAGVMRPTFYYHFQDKYEVLEWIVRSELFDGLGALVERGKGAQALAIAFSSIGSNRDFYKKAFDIIGQNSFDEIFVEQTRSFILEHLRFKEEAAGKTKLVTLELIASRLALDFVNTVRLWLSYPAGEAGVEDIVEAYIYLLSHSYSELYEL